MGERISSLQGVKTVQYPGETPEKPVQKDRPGMLIVYKPSVKGDTRTCPKVQLTRNVAGMILHSEGLQPSSILWRSSSHNSNGVRVPFISPCGPVESIT